MSETPKLVREKRIKWDSEHTKRVSWFVHTQTFSVEFHLTEYTEALVKQHPMLIESNGGYRNGVPCAPFGLEYHYDGEHPGYCRQESCTARGSGCWTSGSSMWASEFFERWTGDDRQVFDALENIARREIAEQAEAAS